MVGDVVRVEQCDEHVHVEERAHQYASSPRNASMTSFVTRRPLGGNGWTPYTDATSRTTAGSTGAVNTRRRSADMT